MEDIVYNTMQSNEQDPVTIALWYRACALYFSFLAYLCSCSSVCSTLCKVNKGKDTIIFKGI